MLERLDLDDSLIPNQHLAIPGSSELSYTSSLASAPERIMVLTTQGLSSFTFSTSNHLNIDLLWSEQPQCDLI